MKANRQKFIVCAVATMLCCGLVRGEDVEANTWHVSPYLWLPSLDVTSKLPGVPATDVDLSFKDIWENFDVFAISGRGEYWWGEWGVVADGLYMDMEADGIGPLFGNGDLKITDGLIDLLAAYRFNLTEDIKGPSARVMAGGRYRYIRQKVKGIPIIGSAGGSRDYIEPLLGWQLLAPMGEKWMATARGDIGGFGIGDGSELTWSVMAGAGWIFADQWMLKLGYRYHYLDYSDGSGLSEFGLEGDMHGPWLGVSYGL
jgi:hypothetical protein